MLVEDEWIGTGRIDLPSFVLDTVPLVCAAASSCQSHEMTRMPYGKPIPVCYILSTCALVVSA